MMDDRYDYAREVVDVYRNATDSDRFFDTVKDQWAKEGWVFVEERPRATNETGKWEVVLTFRRLKSANILKLG